MPHENTTQVRPSTERKVLEWMLSDDTGVSSETMVAIAFDIPKRGHFGLDAPHDPGDFGRCYRLVQSVPEIREHFGKIGEKVKAFHGILANWDELSRIYLRDLPTGRSAELYEKIRKLRGDK